MMATKKDARSDGRENANKDGREDGRTDGTAMDFDAFLVRCASEVDKLHPTAGITRGGNRAGALSLLPLDTLEERCRASWATTSPVSLLLRVKLRANGQVAFSGLLPLDASTAPVATAPAAVAPGGIDPAMLSLLRETLAKLDERAPSRTPSPPLGEQVSALTGLTATFGEMAKLLGIDAKSPKTDGSALDGALVQKLVDLGAQVERAKSGNAEPGFFMKALDMFGGDVKEALAAVIFAAKAKADADEEAGALAAAQRKKAEADLRPATE